MRSDLAARFEVCGFPVFGVDGSRLELPRTESNEQRFSPDSARRKGKPKTKQRRRARSKEARARRAHQKKSDSPQMWLTTIGLLPKNWST
jgi:hypothetical protein